MATSSRPRPSLLCPAAATALAFALAPLLFPATAAAQGDQWFTVSTFDANLRRIDPYTATTLSSVPISLTGRTVVAANGLATHPHTNELYALLQLQGASGNRALAKVDPRTGVATLMGMTGDSFANITFDITGRLFGVTGDGANTAETLYTLDLTTAQPTLFVQLGNGNDGEAIGYHLGSNRIFHASGLGTPNTTEIFESIDVTTRTVTSVPLSGGDWEEVLSLVQFAGDAFLVCDWNFDLWIATTTGRIDRIGTLDHDAKGIANVRTSGGAYFTLTGAGCREPNGRIPVLGASGTPTANASVTLHALNGPPSAPAVIALGTGTGQFSLTTSCTLSALPLTPIVVNVMLDANGAAAVPLTIPPIGQIDVWFQSAVLSSSQLALGNALQMHVQ